MVHCAFIHKLMLNDTSCVFHFELQAINFLILWIDLALISLLLRMTMLDALLNDVCVFLFRQHWRHDVNSLLFILSQSVDQRLRITMTDAGGLSCLVRKT